MNLHVIILAAGKGTRMRSSKPKVLHEIAGKPLLEHVIHIAQKTNPKKIHVVYSNGNRLSNHDEINWVLQQEQLGTGHAVMQVLPFVEQASKALVLYGDVPLITLTTLNKLIDNMPEEGLSLLSAEFLDPTGFGRIVRDDSDNVISIVEHKDATSAQKEIREINSGILVTSSKILRNYLPRLGKDNAQGEYYLTDVIGMLVADGLPINCLLTTDKEEVMGVNDKIQLAKLERKYQENLAEDMMSRGLSLIDPARFDVRGNFTFGDNVLVDVNVVIEGEVEIGSDTIIEPNNILKNSKIGKNVTIKANCVIEEAVIADNCVVGPFARIRPGTVLDDGARVGNFVEVKNTRVGKNSKASHLTYLGDSVIGDNVNIGAGTITCNYDGVDKHKTIIEDSVFVGSNVALVAPVKLGKGSVIGAGSVIVEDAPADKLTIARAKQETIENWERKKKD